MFATRKVPGVGNIVLAPKQGYTKFGTFNHRSNVGFGLVKGSYLNVVRPERNNMDGYGLELNPVSTDE